MRRRIATRTGIATIAFKVSALLMLISHINRSEDSDEPSIAAGISIMSFAVGFGAVFMSCSTENFNNYLRATMKDLVCTIGFCGSVSSGLKALKGIGQDSPNCNSSVLMISSLLALCSYYGIISSKKSLEKIVAANGKLSSNQDYENKLTYSNQRPLNASQRKLQKPLPNSDRTSVMTGQHIDWYYEEKVSSDPYNKVFNTIVWCDWEKLGAGSYNKAYVTYRKDLKLLPESDYRDPWVLKVQHKPKETDSPSRSVRAMKEIRGEKYPVGAVRLPNRTEAWVLPFLAGEVPDDSNNALGVIRVYEYVRRIIIDGCGKGNFITSVNHENRATPVDVGQAYRRGSIISEKNYNERALDRIRRRYWPKMENYFKRPITVTIIKMLFLFDKNKSADEKTWRTAFSNFTRDLIENYCGLLTDKNSRNAIINVMEYDPKIFIHQQKKWAALLVIQENTHILGNYNTRKFILSIVDEVPTELFEKQRRHLIISIIESIYGHMDQGKGQEAQRLFFNILSDDVEEDVRNQQLRCCWILYKSNLTY